MNEQHLNDLLNMDLRLGDYKESSILNNEDIFTLIRTYTRKAIQYAYRDTKSHIPRPCDYDLAINVMKRYYNKLDGEKE